ncbi:MMPL family transporter [Kocuria rhizophila]|nr:MMPL family transporter [Kocuria rhizophila]
MVIALIILLIMLGTFVAAGLPVLMALVGVGAAYLGRSRSQTWWR